MRRTLKHLDPSAVIPDRVKGALDALTEGVILIDTRQQVVLANAAISEKLGVDSTALLGQRLSSLGWSIPGAAGSSPMKYPWLAAMADGENHTGTRMFLNHGDTLCGGRFQN